MPERRRILIVEDDRDLAELLRLQLDAAGFAPEVNLTGEHFLADLARLEPELVVLDWMLPAGEGLELLRRLRREPRFRMLPVILLTARGAEADRVRGLEGERTIMSPSPSARANWWRGSRLGCAAAPAMRPRGCAPAGWNWIWPPMRQNAGTGNWI